MFKKKNLEETDVVVHALILALERQKQADLWVGCNAGLQNEF